MAAPGYVQSLINSIQDETTRTALASVFNYLMRQNSLGNSPKATNFSWFQVTGTTHRTAGAEFSIAHGLGVAPSKFIPVVQLDAVGTSLVSLTVSRIPDARRMYFLSPSTNVSITGFVE